MVVAEPTSIAWERFISVGSAKNNRKAKTMAAPSRRTIQIVVGVMPAAPWTRSRRASSRSEVWSSHFANAVLHGSGRLGCPDRPEERYAPRVEGVTQVARLHPRPLPSDDGACVAHDLPRRADRVSGSRNCAVSELLDDEESLRFGTGPGLIVRREREEDHEAGEDREPRREHAEDAGRPVTVREEAFGGSTAHEENRRDRQRIGDEDDGDAEDETHRAWRPRGPPEMPRSVSATRHRVVITALGSRVLTQGEKVESGAADARVI